MTDRLDKPALQGIPETMLWTLHNRASEAMRPNGLLKDPDAIRIYQSIDYDYHRSFGKPDGSHALRSKLFDRALNLWLADHPDGTVVELASGLETQFQRCDNGQVNWLCVDVPEAIEIRQHYLPANERCRYLPCSALNTRWIDELTNPKNIFISAQGLLMYFKEEETKKLLATINERLPGATLMFDVIPPVFSRKTLKGYWKTPHYQAPPMPWGIARASIVPTLCEWMPNIDQIALTPYGMVRNGLGLMLAVFSRTPVLRNLLPYIVKLTIRKKI